MGIGMENLTTDERDRKDFQGFTAKDAKGAKKILTADLRGCTRICGKRE
jgi:hypothetical protein